MNGRLFTEEQAAAMDETHFSSCRGPCDQGQRLCPCPEACHVPRERMGPLSGWERFALNKSTRSAVLYGLGLIGALAGALAVFK